MKIYDISQELLSSSVYEGDPAPRSELISSIAEGALYNLTALSLCAHNGTHVDAPRHFIDGGNDVASIPLERCVGLSHVISHNGDLTATDAARIVDFVEAHPAHPFFAGDVGKRILIKGDATVTADAARVFANASVDLIGVESQSVGPIDSPMEVHLILLSRKTVLLEGIRLSSVPEGRYLLAAQPISIKNADGAPTRAILISLD